MATPQIRFVVTDDIPEKSSWCYSCTLVDEDSNPIARSSLSTLVLTIYNTDPSLTIVNSVNSTNILNTGRGTVASTSGALSIKFLPADSALIVGTKAREVHIALLEGTYNSGTAGFKHEIEHTIRNLAKVS